MENKGHWTWKYQLPRLLAEMKAKELELPDDILSAPTKFGNLPDTGTWKHDVYRLVHAEGYEYGEDSSSGHGHGIKTGYALRERGEVIARVLETLNGFLVPDGPLIRDIPAPLGRKTPLVFRNHEWISGGKSGTPERRRQYQSTIAEAMCRAKRGEIINLTVLWREPDTRDLIEEQLRHAFLLNAGDNFPTHIHISYVFIEDATLLEVLDKGGFKPSDGEPFKKRLRQQREQKKQAWHKFLKAIFPRNTGWNPALIEMGRSRQKGVSPQQSIYGVIREACALAGVDSQMVQTVTSFDLSSRKVEATKARIRSAVLDMTHRHVGALYGLPADLYRAAQVQEGIAQEMDVIAFSRRRTTTFEQDIHYALAVRLCADGAVDVMLPDADVWIPYSEAGIALGRLFSDARRDQMDDSGNRLGQKRASERQYSRIKLTGHQLAQFAARVLTQSLNRPTLALIEADVWRNERSADEDGRIWPQLKNEHLWDERNILNFLHLPGYQRIYERDDSGMNLLLGVIRLRKGKETPQYVTNRISWNEQRGARDFKHLSGFWDAATPELPHYFSVGRLPLTQRVQDDVEGMGIYKLDHIHKGTKTQFTEYGANIAFKHPQMVEMVPFFVRKDFHTEEGKISLCRAAHYLRSSPAWTMGNLVLPYPMHLGDRLIADQLCILGIED